MNLEMIHSINKKIGNEVGLRQCALLCLLFLLSGLGCFGQKATVDPDLRKDDAQFTRIRYTRTAEDAFIAAATRNTESLEEVELLRHWVKAGQWKDIQEFLKQFHPASSRRIFEKITSDILYKKEETVLTLQEFIALTDASPVEFRGRLVSRISALLQVAMVGAESQAELIELMKKGSVWFGNSTKEKREYTAHVLAYAKYYEAASHFGATESQLREAGSRDPNERGDPSEEDNGVAFDELLKQLNAEKDDPDKQERLLEEIYRRLAKSSPWQLRTMLENVIANDEAFTVYAMLGRETAAASREEDYEARARNLELQAKALRLLNDQQQKEERWQNLAELMQKMWLKEAQLSLLRYPTWIRYTDYRRDKYAHVPFEKLIDAIPVDEKAMDSRIRIPLVRMILYSDEIDRVQPHLKEILKIDQKLATELVNKYVQRWGEIHDPNLSEQVLKEYALDDQAVILTRAEQAAALGKLGDMLNALRPNLLKLVEVEHLIQAFDYCHSDAEIHTLDHVKKVFGVVTELDEDLASALLQQMRNKLSGQWREMNVQEDAATRRSPEDVMIMVKQGYEEATSMATEWLEKHPESWKLEAMTGSLFADWGEFAYFKKLAIGDGQDRFEEYLKHSNAALEHFKKGAAAYSGNIEKMRATDYDLSPFRAWFHGLLGITGPEDVNLRKGVTDASLVELREALQSLPGSASKEHLKMFSEMVAHNLTDGLLAPEMKYRYLASAVKVTGNHPTIYTAADKIQYYDSLLDEIRLQTRVDGSNSIHAGGELGLFVSLVHTAEIARESGGFSNYLLNHIRRRARGNTITEKPMYRDRLEESLRVGLGNFFEVQSIVFADQSVTARDLPKREGWQETPLAYILLKTKDLTVDRIPSLEMELDFFDRNGKVILPVPSHPVQIEISEEAEAARPVENISVTQIVDARELANGVLKIDVSASARGIIPDLDQLLDLKSAPLPINSIDDKATINLKELIINEENLAASSERNWTLDLDPAPLLGGASESIEFDFLKAKSTDSQARPSIVEAINLAIEGRACESAEVSYAVPASSRSHLSERIRIRSQTTGGQPQLW